MRIVRRAGLALLAPFVWVLALTGVLAPAAQAGAYDAHVDPDSGGWKAENPAHGLSFGFTSGVAVRTLSPEASGWHYALTLAAVGYRSDPWTVPPAVPSGIANRVDEKRESVPSLFEWYVNEAGGLQQWIRLEAPLASDWETRSEPIVLDFDVAGGLKPIPTSEGRRIEWLEDERTALRYEEVGAVSADGAVVPVRLEVRTDAQGRPTGMRIVLERGYVAYPIVYRAFLRSAKWAPSGGAIPPAGVGAPPANDSCAGATVVPDGPYPVLSAVTTEVDAATSAGDPQPGCIGAAADNGVWYRWTPAATQLYTLSTCPGTTATNPGDGVLAVYTAADCAGPFTETACDDDGCAAFGPSVIGPRLFQGGTTYYILAAHYPIADGGGAPITQYQIRIDGPSVPPANDLCTGTELIPSGGPFPHLTSVTADVRGATTAGDPPLPSCQPDVSRSLWYTFTPSVSSQYTIESCSESTGTTLEDTVIALYASASGTCAGPFTQVPGACNDDACGLRASLTAPLTAGTAYYVLVWQYSSSPPASEAAAVQLRVLPITPPANDACGGAGSLLLERPVVGTVAGAENDYQLTGPACFTGIGQTPSSGAGRDVVYAFTAPADGTYSFRAQDLGLSGDLVLYVATDCPAAAPGSPVTVGSCLAASNRNGEIAPYAATEEVACLPLTAGQEVSVFVDRNVLATTGGAFRLEASRCLPETEPNETPAGAGLLACGLEGSVTAGDIDYFALGPAAADARVFALADGAAAGSTDFDMRVTTVSATLEYDDLNADTPFGSLSPIVAGTRTSGADTYLRVNHYAPGIASEPYRLYSVVQCPSATASPESEPNDAPAQADQAENDYYLGSLSGPAPSADVDLYRFEAAAGTVVFLGLDNDPDFDGTCTDTRLELLDAAGGAVLAVNDAGAVSNARTPAAGQTSTAPVACAESLAFRVAATGAYLVRVSAGTGAAGDGGQGSYLLSVAPDCTAHCSDGDACTRGDTCRNGACVSGAPVSCDDGNPCTSDTCDPAVGCIHTADTGTSCEDGDACTVGDTCSSAGICASGPVRNCDDGNSCTDDACSVTAACVHSPNNTCGGSPKALGYWKRLCRGPVGSGDHYAQSDVDCVNDTCVFGTVASIADLCGRLEPTPSTDKCEQAEAQLMALTLNVCRGRVLDAQPIQSDCTNHATVLESRLDAGALLCKPARSFSECARAQCESEEINSGEALFADSLRLQLLPGGSIRLTWQRPVSSDTFSTPRSYRVWRRSSSEAPYVMLGETAGLEFTDTTVPAGNWQYEITMTW
jgi:hypothetical protein